MSRASSRSVRRNGRAAETGRDPGPLSAAEVEQFSAVFERAALEIAVLDSLHGGDGGTGDDVTNALRASLEDLRTTGSLRTLAAIVDGVGREPGGDGGAAERVRLKTDRTRRRVSCANVGPECVSLEEKIETLRRREGEIDSATEKCIEYGEHIAMRRETEKNYVDKWEKARVENFKLKFLTKEIELQNKIIELQASLETDKIVNEENEQFLDYTINELQNHIQYWECKYKTDVMEIDEKLQSLSNILKEKTEEVENLKKTYNERQTIIGEHEKNKRKLEEEKKINDLREKMATKIQAWWRGTMVRHRLGPFKLLLGPRKKSIKKPITGKAKKTKNK